MGRLALLAAALSSAAACRSPDAPAGADAPLFSGGRDGADATADGIVLAAPGVLVGAPDRLLIRGTIVTPEVQLDGEVLVEGDTITCVDSVAACDALPGAAGATIIETGGVIAPGMIDTHNHILFDIFDNDDWMPSQVYQDHDQWPSDPKYQAMLDVKQCLVDDSQGKPAWCANTPYGTAAGSLRCEADKFGELKGLVAGTTSIVGLPGTSAACFGSLARSIDVAQNGLGIDKVQTSALYPPSDPQGVCTNFASGKTAAFLVHVGEGDDAKAGAELAALGTSTTPAGCLYAPQTAITHGMAFTAADFAQMAAAGMKLIWSAQSNVSLYGQTADVPAALDAGVEIAIAPDWSMGGSVNLLDELRFADAWDDAHWGDRLSHHDELAMTTTHAADMLALADTIGSLAVGKKADLAVYTGIGTPYDLIAAAHPAQVRLVMVGGVVLYGDPIMEPAAPAAPGCEALDICGTPKFLCAAETSTASKLDQTYADITSALETALEAADAQTPDDGWSFAPLAPLVACGS
jgi:cytosine/adenosine deaminase-related metal-dependent hydrolase